MPGFRAIDLTGDKAEFTLGRHKANDVVVSDVHVSARHCKVVREGAVVRVVDSR